MVRAQGLWESGPCDEQQVIAEGRAKSGEVRDGRGGNHEGAGQQLPGNGTTKVDSTAEESFVVAGFMLNQYLPPLSLLILLGV